MVDADTRALIALFAREPRHTVALRLPCDARMSFDETLNRNAQACGLAVIAP